MEFKLLEPKNEKGFLKSVEFNFEDLKLELIKSLEKYRGIVYGEENLAQAKRDRANLNRLKILFEEERKKIKNLCLSPYFEFEGKIKILTELIDEPLLSLDLQIKIFEEEKRNKKKAMLKNFYITSEKKLSKEIDFERLIEAHWLNSTFPIKNAKCEFSLKIENIKKEIRIIKNLKSLQEDFLLQIYFEELDLEKTLKRKDLIEKEEKAFRKQIKKSGKKSKRIYQITASKSQFEALEDFLCDCSIEFQKG